MRDVPSLFREYVRLDQRRRHEGLSSPELTRWRELTRHLSAALWNQDDPEAEERRVSLRVPVRLRVRFEWEGAPHQAIATNLSPDGVFLNTPLTQEINARLMLRIPRGDGSEIEVPGEVASNRAESDTHQLGMGIRFVDPSSKAHAALERLYAGALERD